MALPWGKIFSGVAVAGIAAVIGNSMGYNFSVINFAPSFNFGGAQQNAPPANTPPQAAPQTTQESAMGPQSSAPADTTNYGPSFSCETDRKWSEQAVCNDASLARDDRQLASLYRIARNNARGAQRGILRDTERAWMKERDDCEFAADPKGCLAMVYRRRIGELGGALP